LPENFWLSMRVILSLLFLKNKKGVMK